MTSLGRVTDLRAAVQILRDRKPSGRVILTSGQAAVLHAHLCATERALAKAVDWCPDSEVPIRDPQLVRDLERIRAVLASAVTT